MSSKLGAAALTLTLLAPSVAGSLSEWTLELLGLVEDDPGWLPMALANTDADVDRAIVAYEAGNYDEALKALDRAEKRRGERAELRYDRGLVLFASGDLEGAQAAFLRGTESKDPQVQASSQFELGNLAMEGEDWAMAIEQYKKCLRIQPDHEDAKWNLELAMERKRQADEEQEEQEKQDQENQDQQDGEQDQDQEDQQGEDGEQDPQDGEQDQQDQGEQDQQDQQDQGEQDQQDGEQDQQDQQDQGEQDQQDQQQPGEQEQEQEQDQQAQPVQAGDIDAALEELDRADPFMFGRPRPTRGEVKEDW